MLAYYHLFNAAAWKRSGINQRIRIQKLHRRCSASFSSINDSSPPSVNLHIHQLKICDFGSAKILVDRGRRDALCPCLCSLARAGKQPENFFHKWLRMGAYNDTYVFHINPIPDQKLWEKSIYNRPQASKFKKMPGAPKKKQKKDADEGPIGGKKQKITKMKRVYKEGSCRHCGGKGHIKRNCAKKKADDDVVTIAAAAATAAAESGEADTGNATEIEFGMSQPIARPPKLPQKKRQPPPAAPASIPPPTTSAAPPNVSNAPPPPTVPISNTPLATTACIDPMVGTFAATASRLHNVLRFVPTPGFKPPRKSKK
ncbi:hypothetical protein Ahy_B03g067002 isoform A [Arachis hypogaea]|uniref:CCHC-type domain-containing protein n=1 Tax=Arachis hypogaea TaxID=3818 RepID=A0A445A5E7_ARAHY|nr:hypothetical protein Ahy_B03g067002 isoform A [Arachis hypogaea]